MNQHLSDHTTLRLGGPVGRLLEVRDESELVALVDECDRTGEPVLFLGGGSNLVVGDAGFPGTVISLRKLSGVEAFVADSAATVRVAAGENWDDLVVRAIAEEWVGVEALSGIPGLAGATPMQNVNAYGQEVAETLTQVRAYDRVERTIRMLDVSECGFGYRTSRFKRETDRWVVLGVVFRLERGSLGAPVRYVELARRLGVELGGRAPLADVRNAVLALRRGKGMVLDPEDHDTWSAGSFFTNPIVMASDADGLPDDAPRWPQGDGLVKTNAGWLIEHAGFVKGYGNGRVRLSSKHTLALTNRGGATTEELLALAREIRDGVEKAYGITLEPEPSLVGCSL